MRKEITTKIAIFCKKEICKIIYKKDWGKMPFVRLFCI